MATMYNPPHLGELIRESVEAEGWSVTETARRLGMGRVALSRVLNGHAGVSAALALALERIGWSDAEHWMRMQAIYDLAQERRSQAPPRGHGPPSRRVNRLTEQRGVSAEILRCGGCTQFRRSCRSDVAARPGGPRRNRRRLPAASSRLLLITATWSLPA